MEQLTLTVGLSTPNSFDNYFCSADNKIAVTTLKQLALDGAGPVVGLQGAQGTGKSHLLQACCASVSSAQCAYISMRDVVNMPAAAVLENLEVVPLVAIDDMDQAFGHAEWELALFHFYNRLVDAGNSLAFTLSKPLQNCTGVMPDLLSRLKLGLVFGLKPLQDEQLIEMFVMRADELGIKASEDVVNYVFRHCERDISSLLVFLQKLDQLSLTERRKPSVPLVKKLLSQQSLFH